MQHLISTPIERFTIAGLIALAGTVGLGAAAHADEPAAASARTDTAGTTGEERLRLPPVASVASVTSVGEGRRARRWCSPHQDRGHRSPLLSRS